jgi:hypothetical protein
MPDEESKGEKLWEKSYVFAVFIFGSMIGLSACKPDQREDSESSVSTAKASIVNNLLLKKLQQVRRRA